MRQGQQARRRPAYGHPRQKGSPKRHSPYTWLTQRRASCSLYLFLLIPGLAVAALSASALMPRQYVTRQQLAERFGITDRTVSNLISRGVLTGYQLPGVRAIRVDLNEAEALVKAVPTAFKQRKPFGPDARIIRVAEVLPPRPEAADQAQDQAAGQDQTEMVAGGER